MSARQSPPVRHHLRRRSDEHDATAVMACAGAHVDDPVGVRHDRLMVLDDDDGATGVHKPVQQREHGLDIGRVKPNGRLVKDNDAAFLAQVVG